jgi:hypothetical protein
MSPLVIAVTRPNLRHHSIRAPCRKLRAELKLLQPERQRVRALSILQRKRQNLRRAHQGFVQSVGSGDDSGQIGERDAVAGRRMVDEGDVGAVGRVVCLWES